MFILMRFNGAAKSDSPPDECLVHLKENSANGKSPRSLSTQAISRLSQQPRIRRGFSTSSQHSGSRCTVNAPPLHKEHRTLNLPGHNSLHCEQWMKKCAFERCFSEIESEVNH